MSAPYLITIDVGATLLKAALLHQEASGQPKLLQALTYPAMALQQDLGHVIDDLVSAHPEVSSSTYELALIGHPPDHTSFQQAAKVLRFSHEEALHTITKRLSSSGTIVVLDIGARRTMVALGKYGKVSVETFDIGVGEKSWDFLRQQVQSQQLKAWLAMNISETEIENYIANKSMYPHIIPISVRELAIEQALAKVVLQHVAQQLPFPWDEIQEVILTGSALSQPTNPNQPVSMLLDGLQPTGTFQLSVDGQMLLYALGAVFGHWMPDNYLLSKPMLHSTIQKLGTLICPINGATKQPIKVTLDTGLATEQKLVIRPGEIVQIPLSDRDTGQVTITQKTVKDHAAPAENSAVGGDVGIVIDGRSRPIMLASKDGERLSQLSAWNKQLNVYHQIGQIGPPGGSA